MFYMFIFLYVPLEDDYPNHLFLLQYIYLQYYHGLGELLQYYHGLRSAAKRSREACFL